MQLRQIIADRMIELELSQAELARRAGVHRVRVADYLAERRDLRGSSIESLLDALDLHCVPRGDARPARTSSAPRSRPRSS